MIWLVNNYLDVEVGAAVLILEKGLEGILPLTDGVVQPKTNEQSYKCNFHPSNAVLISASFYKSTPENKILNGLFSNIGRRSSVWRPCSFSSVRRTYVKIKILVEEKIRDDFRRNYSAKK